MKIGKTGNMSIFFRRADGRGGGMRYLVDDGVADQRHSSSARRCVRKDGRAHDDANRFLIQDHQQMGIHVFSLVVERSAPPHGLRRAPSVLLMLINRVVNDVILCVCIANSVLILQWDRFARSRSLRCPMSLDHLLEKAVSFCERYRNSQPSSRGERGWRRLNRLLFRASRAMRSGAISAWIWCSSCGANGVSAKGATRSS